MRAPIVLFSVFCVLQITAPIANAQPSNPAVYAGLERVADVAARIQSVYCDPDTMRVFQGAIDSINAMPERSNAAPIHMQTPDIDGFANAYGDLLKENIDYASVENAAINGMIQTFDASNEYVTSAAARPLGDGAVLLTLDGSRPNPTVIRVMPDGPAALAGVLAGDRLIAIDGQSTTGQRLYDIAQHLRGAAGSNVTLTVRRDSSEINLPMTRVRAAYAPVGWRVANGVGVITIQSFSEHSSRDVRDAIRAIRREVHQPVGYVLDLRDNWGGLLDQVIGTIDLFVDGGPVLIVRPVSHCSRDVLDRYNARGGDETEGARILVLVNANTASGAEIAAASLRDVRHAVLVGQPTFGNAKVHVFIPMHGGRDGFLRLRTGTLSTPSGTNFDGTGLTPDVVSEARDAQTDPAMDQALSMLRTPPGQ